MATGLTLALPYDLAGAIDRLAAVERKPPDVIAVELLRSVLEDEGWLDAIQAGTLNPGQGTKIH